MLIDLRGERQEREKEKNIHVKEKHWSVACHMHPDQGLNLQTGYVPWSGNELQPFGLRDGKLQLTNQALLLIFKQRDQSEQLKETGKINS